MENASKALVMAGGVLIAVMIILLIYSFVGTLSERAKSDEEELKIKQTIKFNKEYESYERKLLRGTDLITLMNKAISNNKKYLDQENIYDINIVFTLETPVTIYTVEIKNGIEYKTHSEEAFENDVPYELIDTKERSKVNKQIEDFVKFGIVKKKDSYLIENYVDDMNYTKVYDYFTAFKRKYFKCVKIEYSEQTGRVNLMEFREIKQKDESASY